MRGEIVVPKSANLLRKRTFSRDFIQNTIVLCVGMVIMAIFGLSSPYFLTWNNIVALLVAMVPSGLILIGECYLMIAGEWDMAPGNVASLAGMVWGALIVHTQLAYWLCFVIALMVGVIFGAFTGGVCNRFGVPAWMASYAVMQICTTFTYLINDGKAIPLREHAPIKWLGQADLLGTGLTPAVIIMLVLIGIGAFVLRYTQFGRDLYLIGGNREAAYNVGLNVNLYRMACFIICGVMSALAGLLFASRSASAQINACGLCAFNGIAGTMISSGSLAGGRGNLIMAAIGVFLIVSLQNGLYMMGVSVFYQYMVTGLALFVAVFAQADRKK